MKKLLLIVLILVLSCAMLIGCKPTEPSAIAIVEGSLSSTFAVDAEFPTSALLSVTVGEAVQTYEITPDMVEGFDTSTSTYGEERTLTVRYKDLTTTHKYTVNGDVNTKARVVGKVETVEGQTVVTLSLDGLTTTDGAYALQMEVYLNSTLATLKDVKCIADGWAIAPSTKGNKTRLVVYNAKGDNRLISTTDIIKLTYTKTNTADITLTIDGENGYIEMADGDANGEVITRRMPSVTVVI